MLKDFPIKKSFFVSSSLFLHYIKKIDISILPCICSVIDHRRCQNVGRNISDTPPHFDIICDLLPNRCTETLSLFVNIFCTGISLILMWLQCLYIYQFVIILIQVNCLLLVLSIL